MTWEIRQGDACAQLRALPAESVQTCVTSPPYFGLRDYGIDGQLGLEATPDEYVDRLVDVFREVHRVLRDDGTLWLNLGDSYARQGGAGSGGSFDAERPGWHPRTWREGASPPAGLKEKDLIGIPWMVAFALRADGWYLRAENIWAKPNPMPESVRDRTTRSHESVFMLTKAPRYFYDAAAVREDDCGKPSGNSFITTTTGEARLGHRLLGGLAKGGSAEPWEPGGGRNKRDVWTVATHAFPDAHFAVFPPALIEPCILAGSPKGGKVLDPFAGSGTAGVVCGWHGRDFIGIELNPEYAEMARARITAEGKPGRRLSPVDAPLVGQMDLLGKVSA